MKDAKPQARKSIVDFVHSQLQTHATQLSEDQSRELASSLTRQVISEVSAMIAAEVALQAAEIASVNALPSNPKGK